MKKDSDSKIIFDIVLNVIGMSIVIGIIFFIASCSS